MIELTLCESIAEIGPEVFFELEGPEHFPFLRFSWLSALEESGCVGPRTGWIPRHIVVRRGPELCAFAPAYIKLDSWGEFVFDQSWAEASEMRLQVPYYPKLVMAIPFTPATGPRILFRKGMDEQERSEVYDLLSHAGPEIVERLGLSSVHLLFPDERDANEFEARGWTRRSGLQFQFFRRDQRNFSDFLDGFKAKRRAAIRRELRAMDDAGIAIEPATGGDLSADDGQLAYRLYLTTVDKYFYGRRYLTQGFFSRVISEMPDAIHLVLARDAAGDVLGGAFNLLGSEALYGRYWGAFSEVPFLHFNVCLYRGVEECLRLGLERFEPGAGGGHKEGRGFQPTETRSLHYIKDARLAAAVEDFCKREADHVAERISAP